VLHDSVRLICSGQMIASPGFWNGCSMLIVDGASNAVACSIASKMARQVPAHIIHQHVANNYCDPYNFALRLSEWMYDSTSSRQLMEDKMTALKSLTFTALPKIGANPVMDRRAKIIERLEEQKQLLSDPNYKRVVRTSVKKDGQRVPVEKHQRVLPWWRTAPNGAYAFFIRAGYKTVEFDKGKAAVSVPSIDKLPAVIDTLIAAIRAGELDQQLAEASKQATPKKSRKAA
jgi:hypothetical protein